MFAPNSLTLVAEKQGVHALHGVLGVLVEKPTTSDPASDQAFSCPNSNVQSRDDPCVKVCSRMSKH
jgi:hypothetical protein